jgi:hypothetical protein
VTLPLMTATVSVPALVLRAVTRAKLLATRFEPFTSATTSPPLPFTCGLNFRTRKPGR